MEKIITKTEKLLESIDDTDNYEKKVDIYKKVNKMITECSDKLNTIKDTIECPEKYIEENNDYHLSDDSVSNIVPPDYTEMKQLLDKSELFDHYVKRLEELQQLYETEMDVDKKLEIYVETYSVIHWCKSYLNSKTLDTHEV